MVYIQYERDSDTYFKAFLLKQYLQKMKKKNNFFLHITES